MPGARGRAVSSAYDELIVSIATVTGVNPRLAAAVCDVESSRNPWAYNPEPRYRYLWDVVTRAPFRALTDSEQTSEIPPLDFPSPLGAPRDAEWWGQQASWGLMQVMGAVARERGFLGTFLPELCNPETGLLYGCLHLAAQCRRYPAFADALAAYNAGRPGTTAGVAYAEKVLSRMGSSSTA